LFTLILVIVVAVSGQGSAAELVALSLPERQQQ